jgi:hypothetical protein
MHCVDVGNALEPAYHQRALTFSPGGDMDNRIFKYRPVNWVIIKRAAELTGRTVKSLNHLVANGHLLEGVHWKWSPDNRRHFSLDAFDEWEAKSKSGATRRRRSRTREKAEGK